MMSNLSPPQPPPTWTHTPEGITALVKKFIADDVEIWDKIGLLPKEECTFESVRLLQSVSMEIKSNCLTALGFDQVFVE